MEVELQINNSAEANARFVTWAPSPCRIRMTDPAGTTTDPVNIRLTSVSGATGGTVRFSEESTGPYSNSLTLPVPTGGTSVNFFVAGKFGEPSTNLDDVTIQAKAGASVVGSVDLMVRIRKNANTLTNAERDRFIAAFAQLNNQGMGRFADFRDMHTNISSPQAHGAAGFLPWHRAYILDLERELQAIDPSVALPYWRFDEPAPNLFTADFIGDSDFLGNVQFSASNPLRFWRTDGVPGVSRRPQFDTSIESAFVISEADTLALGTDYVDFVGMEIDPHGSAHTSFGGSISSIHTAARDPLFFLLHCNVDRLWAKWQKTNGRYDPTTPQSYDPNPNPLGHNLPDTMWPWNGVTGAPRPPTAPGGTLADSPWVTAPGRTPKVEDCLDYRGVILSTNPMGFDYDDIDID
jgi:tyrosinase